jgi:hypothetical protein
MGCGLDGVVTVVVKGRKHLGQRLGQQRKKYTSEQLDKHSIESQSESPGKYCNENPDMDVVDIPYRMRMWV